MGICTSKRTEPKTSSNPAALPSTTATHSFIPFHQTEFASLPLEKLLLSEDDERHKRFKQWCRTSPNKHARLVEMLECGEAIWKRGNLYVQGKRMDDDEDLSRDRLATNARPIINKYLTPGAEKAVPFVDAECVKVVRGETADLSEPRLFDSVSEELVRTFGEAVKES
ncbi:hypothetical protein HDV00_007943 [Rhizophlyctis rosea]|nr:hypothetical protein HDV00_007943 [Rhizophlyctis rosea]